MLTIIITPCLLGFDVKTRQGAFERSRGILSFHEVIWNLLNTDCDFTIVIH